MKTKVSLKYYVNGCTLGSAPEKLNLIKKMIILEFSHDTSKKAREHEDVSVISHLFFSETVTLFLLSDLNIQIE